MIKKIVIGILAVILVGAVAVGAYDSARGASSLSLPEFDAGSLGFGQGQASGRGGQQGRGQEAQGQGGQGQGYGRSQDAPGQASGRGGQQGQGNGAGTPQAMVEHSWLTLTGTVAAFDPQGLVVDTAERGRLDLRLGPPGFAEQQGVTFTPGEAVTILGFDGEDNMFQAGEVTNDTTGATLYLRDPNGRPLWAGRGQGQGGRGQGAQGSNG